MLHALDTFQRPDQEGWGVASDGHLWFDDASEHPGAITSIRQGVGYVDTLTANTDLDQWLGDSAADALISADFQVLEYWRGQTQRCARLLGRVVDGHQFLVFAINFGNSTLQIWVNDREQWWKIEQVEMPPFRTHQWYRAQFLLVGPLACGKVWPVGAAEPEWQIKGSQNALTSGMGGLRTTYARVYWANFSVRAVTTTTS